MTDTATRRRRIAVVTVARSDYGIYRPVLRRLAADSAFDLQIVAASAHLSDAFGRTADLIERDGFSIAARVDMLLPSDTPEAIAESSGRGTMGFAHAFAELQPDLLLVLGDRFDMHAAVVAAAPFGLPVAHIHGGEATEGAIDNLFRHSITKMSHLHFVANEPFARRVVQMGEEPWRVTVSGAPALDDLDAIDYLDRPALESRFGITLEPPVALVTVHAETLRPVDSGAAVDELLAAVKTFEGTVVFTSAGADTNARAIGGRIEAFLPTRPRTWLLGTLGTEGYFSMMKLASVMIGNSSSGIIEAPSFELPVVNIGDRQAGRLRAANVVDVDGDRTSIVGGIRRALDPAFRATLRGLCNPYGDGHAAERIADRLASVPLDRTLLTKRFHDLPA